MTVSGGDSLRATERQCRAGDVHHRLAHEVLSAKHRSERRLRWPLRIAQPGRVNTSLDFQYTTSDHSSKNQGFSTGAVRCSGPEIARTRADFDRFSEMSEN